MARTVSRRPLTAEARVHARASPRGICGDIVALGQVFLRFLRFSPVNVSPPWLSILIIIWGLNSTPFGGHRSKTSSHPIDIDQNNGLHICSYTGLAFCFDTILVPPDCRWGQERPRSCFFVSIQNASSVLVTSFGGGFQTIFRQTLVLWEDVPVEFHRKRSPWWRVNAKIKLSIWKIRNALYSRKIFGWRSFILCVEVIAMKCVSGINSPLWAFAFSGEFFSERFSNILLQTEKSEKPDDDRLVRNM
jgi:hypothetical protein